MLVKFILQLYIFDWFINIILTQNSEWINCDEDKVIHKLIKLIFRKESFHARLAQPYHDITTVLSMHPIMVDHIQGSYAGNGWAYYKPCYKAMDPGPYVKFWVWNLRKKALFARYSQTMWQENVKCWGCRATPFPAISKVFWVSFFVCLTFPRLGSPPPC